MRLKYGRQNSTFSFGIVNAQRLFYLHIMLKPCFAKCLCFPLQHDLRARHVSSKVTTKWRSKCFASCYTNHLRSVIVVNHTVLIFPMNDYDWETFWFDFLAVKYPVGRCQVSEFFSILLPIFNQWLIDIVVGCLFVVSYYYSLKLLYRWKQRVY